MGPWTHRGAGRKRGIRGRGGGVRGQRNGGKVGSLVVSAIAKLPSYHIRLLTVAGTGLSQWNQLHLLHPHPFFR